MAGSIKIESLKTKGKPIRDEMHVRRGKGNSIEEVKISVNALKYQDKNTGHFVVYIPALELSGYGETKAKAEMMIQHSLKDIIDYLISLSKDKFSAYLRELGWNHHKALNKEYSRTFVDMRGELMGFAVDEKVECDTVTA
ncbi:MAG: hypothetical protein MUF75_11770 [Bacteroidia bacterium]|jgi:hypothetical protein|nr:hypothetical protein [Bacteroidia bacterium]